MLVSLDKSDRWYWLEPATTRSTKLLWQGRQELWKTSRTVHLTETENEWYAEPIAHSISGGGAEVEVT